MAKNNSNKLKELLHELKHHAPFTAFATLAAIGIVLLLQYFTNTNVSETFFDILHPVHIIASSIVSAGIYYKYKSKIFPALLIGIFGAILIGSFSDILIPWIGGNIFGLNTEFHLPLIEFPFIIFGAALMGSIIGISTKRTKMPHFTHVFLSVFASLFYLLAFSQIFNPLYFFAAFLVVFIAVIIPCCISDIVFPFLFLEKNIKSCNC